jgi:ABC-type bacteriocin/lantibiotic exporters, contain an N-terminal double-glycine peptidase domain
MQTEAQDCGAACIAMVLSAFHKYVTLDSIRHNCNPGRDGTTARQICRTAMFYDLKPKATSSNLAYLKNKCTYPAVLHWNFNHFVVLNGFVGNKAVISDPAKGNLYVPPEELGKAFTGVCIEFEKTPAFRSEGKQKKPRHFMRETVKSRKSATLLLVIAALLASVASVITPFTYRFFMDHVLLGSFSNTQSFFLFLGGLAIFQAFTNVLFGKVKLWYRNSLQTGNTIRYMSHCLNLPLSFFSGRYSSELINRSDENDFIADMTTSQITGNVTALILLAIYAAIMFRYSRTIALLAIPLIFLELISYSILNHIQNRIIANIFELENRATGTAINGIEMIETIKALGAEEGFFTSWSGIKGRIFNTKSAHARTSVLGRILPSVISQLASVLILSLGVYAIMQGEMTIGTLMAFQAFFSNFLSPAQDLMKNTSKLSKLTTMLQRHSDIEQYREDPTLTDENSTNPDRPTGKIEFRNVTFGYSESAPPILENFNLTIEPGEKVGFVGLSGSGKSTIFKLISGLLLPQKGEILFDGKPRSAFSREAMISSIAVSGQSKIFFQDTIEDNLSMWDESVKPEDIIDSCRKAYIHATITRRTRGYSEIIADHGKNFSGGELQRLEIARILASKCNIVLLDETTSALDVKTEGQVLKSVFATNATILLISHRIGAVRDMDRILVFDGGKIVEEGSHEELFTSGGLYSRLVTTE